MAFDPSSAEPVAAVAEPEFDASSAEPVAPVTPAKPKKLAYEIGEEVPGVDPSETAFLKDVNRSGFRTEGSFQEKRLKPAYEEAMTGVTLPDAPEIPAAVDPTGGGRVAAALYQGGVKPLLEGITAPVSLVLIPLGLASGVSPIAKGIERAAAAYFAGDLAQAGGAEAANTVEVLNDPNSTAQQKLTSITKTASTLGMSGLLAGHSAGVKFDSASAEPVSTLADQPVKVEVKRSNGKMVEVEMPASQAEAAIKKNMDSLNAELDAVYKQAGIDRTAPKPAEKPQAFDPASAEPLVSEEPFVKATAEAVATPEPEVQFTIQRPQPHPETGAEIPGYVQVEARTNQGRGEPLSAEQKARYPSTEEALSTDLPTGQYTLDEVRSAITSTKNAQVERERAARGIEAADQAIVREFPEVKEQAETIVKDDPLAGERLVAELKETPRALTDVENAVLLHRQVQLQNEFRETPLSDRATIDRIADELVDIYNVGKEAGTETGRGLNARKMAVAEDFTLANLVTMRAAAKGTRLSPKEYAETAALHDKIETLQKEYDDYRRQASELLMKDEAPAAKRSRIVEVLSTRADAARERLKARLQSGRVSAGLDPADLRDYAEIGAYHIARGVEAAAEWSAEMVKEFGDNIVPHLAAIREQANKVRVDAESAKSDASKLSAYKTRTEKRAAELEAKTAAGDTSKPARKEVVKDEEARQLQARLESAKAEYAAMLEKDRYDKLSGIGKLREQGINTYDAARNIMTTGEFSFIARQGKVTALSHPILSARAIPSAFKALLADEVGARAIDLQTMNKPEIPAARAAKLHLVEEGAKLSRQEEIFASKWAEKIPVLRNFNQAGRVFLNKVRFDVWKTLRDQAPEITPERDAQLAKFVNQATGRGGLGPAEPIAVALGRGLFSPRFLASRIQLLVGNSMWGGDAVTRKIIAKEYARTLVALGVYYTMLSQMTDENGNPATIEKDPRSSDFGKVKIGNSRLDPLAGLSQVITVAARLGTQETKTGKGKVIDLKASKFGGQNEEGVAARFARSKLHPVPGSLYNLYKGTDLAGNQATIANQSLNFIAPMTYADIYEALEEQDLPTGVSLSLLALLGEGLQTYDANKKRPKPVSPNKN